MKTLMKFREMVDQRLLRGPAPDLARSLYSTPRPPLRTGPKDRPERSRRGPLPAEGPPLSGEK